LLIDYLDIASSRLAGGMYPASSSSLPRWVSVGKGERRAQLFSGIKE